MRDLWVVGNACGSVGAYVVSMSDFVAHIAPLQPWAAEQTARRTRQHLCGPRSPPRPPPARGSAEGKNKAAPAPAQTARRRSRAACAMPSAMAKQRVLRALLQSMHGQTAGRASARPLLAGPHMSALRRVPTEAAA